MPLIILKSKDRPEKKRAKFTKMVRRIYKLRVQNFHLQNSDNPSYNFYLQPSISVSSITIPFHFTMQRCKTHRSAAM